MHIISIRPKLFYTSRSMNKTMWNVDCRASDGFRKNN